MSVNGLEDKGTDTKIPVVPTRNVMAVLAKQIGAGYVRLIGWFNALAAAVIFILMLLVSADVTGRYVFSHPVAGTFEAGEVLLVFIVFLGLAYSQYNKGHIRIELLTSRLPDRLKPLADMLTHAVGFAMFAVIFYETGRYSLESFRIKEVAMGMVYVPVWPARFAVPIGCFLLLIQYAVDVRNDWRRFLEK